MITFFNISNAGGGVSGITTADNGLTANTATNVRLGGTLIAATVIDVAGQSLQFTGLQGNSTLLVAINGNQFSIDLGDTPSGDDTSLFIQPGTIDLAVSNGVTADVIDFSLTGGSGGGPMVCLLNMTVGANSLGFSITEGIPGIVVLDTIDSIGLVGDTDFSAAAVLNPNAYAQVSTVQALIPTAPIIKDAVEILGQTTTQTVFTFATPLSSNVIYRANASGYVHTVAGGTVTYNLVYTDIGSVVRTVSFGVALNAVGQSSYPPIVFKALQNTNIQITAVVTGTINYDAGGILELLF